MTPAEHDETLAAARNSGVKIPIDYLSKDYVEYQKRYAQNIRESDRVLIDMVGARLADAGPQAKLLDIGASTGNFLLHLRRAFPEMTLIGSDVLPSVVELARKDPDLSEISFEVLDILADVPEADYDIVVANALFHFFGPDELQRCLTNIGRLLRPGGHLLGFGWLNPFEQTLLIREVSTAHPEGVIGNIHAIKAVERMMGAAGLAHSEFQFFEIPVDLAKPTSKADLVSHTRTAADGRRMLFRGSLYQPWHHFRAVKT